jgi:hypothetical protein
MKEPVWTPAPLLVVLMLGGVSASALAAMGGTLEGRYHCDSNKSDITVRYGFDGDKPAKAQVKYQGKVLNMKVDRKSLSAGETEGMLRFEGRSGYEWVTDYFTRQSFDTSEGNMLMKGDMIQAKYCKKVK